MVEFRKVTYDDVRPLCRVQVAEAQQHMVSPNAFTLGEMNFEPGALVQGIWEGDAPVGLLAIVDVRIKVDMAGDRPRPDAAYLWRLMVGEGHQGKGYGSAAIAEAVRIAGNWGFDSLTLTVADAPDSALGFYVAHGFALTGRTLWGDELEMYRPVASSCHNRV